MVDALTKGHTSKPSLDITESDLILADINDYGYDILMMTKRGTRIRFKSIVNHVFHDEDDIEQWWKLP